MKTETVQGRWINRAVEQMETTAQRLNEFSLQIAELSAECRPAVGHQLKQIAQRLEAHRDLLRECSAPF